MNKATLTLAALAGMTATASASYVNIADLSTAPIIQISGATAPDNTFKSFLILDDSKGGIFQDDTIRRFTGSTSGDDFTITCGLPTAAALGTISDLTNFKDAAGEDRTASTTIPLCVQKVAHGSGQGTSGIVSIDTDAPFADLQAIVATWDDTSDQNATTASFTTGNGGGTVETSEEDNSSDPDNASYMLHSGFVSTSGNNIHDDSILPDCGVADVEPILFTNVNDASPYKTYPIFDIPWGLPVSIPFYYALQFAQLAGDCLPSSTNYDTSASSTWDGSADGVDTSAACVPSLRTSDIRSIFTGDIFYTEELFDETGVAVEDLTVLTDFTSGHNVLGAESANADLQGGDVNDNVTGIPAHADHGDSYIYLCRRKVSSGTQASYEAKFLRQRCEDGSLVMAAGTLENGLPDSSSTNSQNGSDANFLGSATNERVFMNSGSSDVSECVTNATVQNVWAIGINSTEKVPHLTSKLSAGRAGFAHVKIDGVLPSSLNVTTGHHPYFSSLAGNVRNGTEDQGGAPEFCVENIFEKAGNTTVIAAVQAGFQHGWGQGGPMASAEQGVNSLPYSTYEDTGGLTEAEYILNPVNNYSVNTTGSLNNCAYPTKIPSIKGDGTIIPTVIGEIK